MKNCFIIFFLFSIPVQLAFGQDTLSFKTKQIDVIESSSKAQNNYLLNKNIMLSDFDKSLNNNDILRYNTNLNIKEYGGLGSLTTISFRGTNANQTIFTIDGIKINSAGNPFFDINKIDLSSYDNINLINSGNSTQFGSGAMGGVVDFAYSKVSAKLFNLMINSDLTNSLKFKINLVNYLFKNAQNRVNASFLYNNGKFPIEFNKFGKIVDTMRNSSSIYNFSISNYYNKLTNLFEIKNITFFNYQNQEVPGAVLIGKLENTHANLKQFSLMNLTSFNFVKSQFISHLNWINSYDFYHFTDNEQIINSSKFNSYKTMIYADLYKFNNRLFSAQFHAETGVELLNGNMLQPNLPNTIHRINISANSNLFNYYLDSSLKVSVAGRVDKFSDFEKFIFSYSGSLLYNFQNNASIILSSSYNYRLPSFNEMYYFNYGNTDLLPESSFNHNLSLNTKLLKLLDINSTLFINFIDNQIVSIPKNTLSWTAQNFNKVLNKGIEINLGTRLFNNSLNTYISYLYQDTYDNNQQSINYFKEIPYIPKESISLNTTLKIKYFDFTTQLYHSSYRFIFPDNNVYEFLKGYTLINLHISKKILFEKNYLLITITANNVLDIKYELVKNYPMPGRTFLLTLNYTVNG